MKKTSLLSIFALILAFTISATRTFAASPIHWDAKVTMISDTEGIVSLTANIENGWHLYGTSLPEDGPSPTKLYFTPQGVKWIGHVKVSPKTTKEMDDMFGIELSYWNQKATFTRKFVVTDPNEASIKIKVNYMCCNDSNCRPPVDEEFTLSIPRK